jgi:predicted DNA-binding transcriptional regulator
VKLAFLIIRTDFTVVLQVLQKGLTMELVGFALVGVVLGAVGTEFLRAHKPELVEKVENAARRFVDSLCSSKSDDEEAKEK